MEYTKGEWKLHPKHAWVMDDNGSVIANCTGHKNPEANANLVAAAPDLYEALKAMYEMCNIMPDDTDYRVAARKALAKAEGK